ncbi:hypothetical protein F4820DRAFT_444719 [Hypoxylon rubiginosum]|uniref:Uncharacterized protein n=1 Tax=Hypoxylon rubiginosum TaxID=110542 RepID=A0ACB9ZBI7_9PEZI|nr:hypothetical protein F4820DRAFT_444719 [Hypoxylon rubiginosum]
MANPRNQASSFQQSLYGFLQTLFTIALFAIFVIAWAVQSGSIVLPQWAIAWNNATPEERATYTAALVPSVCILAPPGVSTVEHTSGSYAAKHSYYYS